MEVGQTGSKVRKWTDKVTNRSSVKREVITGELITENFAHLVTYCNGDRWLSGWDVELNDNLVDSAFCQWFKIIKKSGTGPFSMKKKFVEQEDSVVTLETRINCSSSLGFSIVLLSGESEAVEIFTDNENICVFDSNDKKIQIQEYKAGIEYGIKVIADIPKNTFDLYINGIQKASKIHFLCKTDKLNHLSFSVSGESAGEIFLRTIRLYRGYAVNERFISTVEGMIPTDWSSNAGQNNIAVRELWCDLSPDIYSVYINNSKDVRNIVLSKEFKPIEGKSIVDFQWMLPTRVSGFRTEISTFAGLSVKLLWDGDSLMYVDAEGAATLIYDYLPNSWYRMRALIDSESETVSIWISGKLKAEGLTLSRSSLSTSGLYFMSGDEPDFTLWLDDILVYPFQELPIDYVPAPIAIDTSPYTVGIQCCSLWKEGSHNGWDAVSQDMRRKPLLGWYEEGKPETSDWQTKWMVEHGITFNLYCWYPPFGRPAVPIKRSLSDYDLVDGFYYGQYSNSLKYMIMWENGNTTCEGFEDYKKNLVPFWIENHFKDPRYLSMDGKPVMGFYDPVNLVKQVGGEENAAKALDYLRQECSKAGFNGVHIICEYRGIDHEQMLKYQEIGFEDCYSYTWFTGDPKLQKEKNLAQKSAESISIIPSACMGWMPSAWGGQDVSWSTPEEFESLLQWIKDELMPQISDKEYGNKMVMLGNWNEYGEGHFIIPTNLYGFGYLDAIRNVFITEEKKHTDVIPTEEQMARLDTLYPREW